MGYITPHGRAAVKEYKYKGEDRSLLYKYILSPLAQACVDNFTPMHAAPNLITLIGLIFQGVAFACVFGGSLNLTEAPPRWACAVAGLCLFCYSTLDNMDGKQARRTGASSALGLLFDHGCDAVNAGIIGSLVFAKCVVVGEAGWKSYLLWACATVPFFMNTWEEFHLREFILPIVNGPNEGLMTLMLFFFASAVWGPEVWHQPAHLWGRETFSELLQRVPLWQMPIAVGSSAMTPVISFIRGVAFDPSTAPATYLEVALASVSCGVVFTCAYNTVNVLLEVTKHADVGSGPARVAAALGRQAPLWLLQLACGLWLFTDATHRVAATHTFMWLLTGGCLFSDFTSKLMVSHACDQPYRPAYFGTALFAAAPVLQRLAAAGFAVPPSLLSTQASEVMLLLAFVLSSSSLVAFAYEAVTDIAHALDIDVFDITRQRRRAGRL